jgi:hypothetical protein
MPRIIIFVKQNVQQEQSIMNVFDKSGIPFLTFILSSLQATAVLYHVTASAFFSISGNL